MNINWKVRIKNPAFWAGIAMAVILPILAHLGMNWEDITTWQAFGNLFVSAVQNPTILVAVVVSVYNAVVDPTTKGLGDSQNAMTYDKPN